MPTSYAKLPAHLPALPSRFLLPEAEGFGHRSLKTPKNVPGRTGRIQAGCPVGSCRARKDVRATHRANLLPSSAPRHILRPQKKHKPQGLIFRQLLKRAGEVRVAFLAREDQHVLCKLEWFQLRHAVPNGSG